MANGNNTPYGLRPIFSKLGGSWTEKVNQYDIDAASINIFTGDPVVWNTTADREGTITRYDFSKHGSYHDNNQDLVIGVFQGCEYTLATGELVKSSYWPGNVTVRAGSKIKAYVLDDAYTVYSIQVSTYSDALIDTVFQQKYVGSNFGFGLGNGDNHINVNNPTDGTTRTGQSAVFLATKFSVTENGHGVDIEHTTATLPLKVMGFELNPQIDQTKAYGSVLVTINNHVDKAGTLGAVA